MTPDPLQEAWQSQPRPAIDTDRLVREFRRGRQQFAATIFWRDVREVGVSLVLLPVWVAMGVGIGLPWTWYLEMPALLWVAVFMTADRMRQRRRRAGPGDTLIRGVECSLAEVEHQIWLLLNVVWWYLLPLGIPMLAFFAQTFWQASRGDVWEAAIATSFVTVVVGGVLAWVYWLNQKAVRAVLEPRRQELAAMLKSLSDEPLSTDTSRSATGDPSS
jgi:hypothetical protein